MRRCKKLAVFLVAVLLLSMVSTQTGILETKAAVKNNITEVGIKALPKNNTIKVGESFNFNPAVLNTQQGKGKETTGAVYFEVKAGTNTAGVQSSRWGYMYPVYAGQFEIRAVAFANTKDMNTWLAARKANGYIEDAKAGAKYVTAYSDWKTIQVTSDEEGLAVARWQKQLDLALKNKKVTNVRFTTDAEQEFTLKKGNYRYKTITIDAPNADIVNEGRFKEITVEQIKSSTFTERAVGNKFVVRDSDASFRVEKDAVIGELVYQPATNNVVTPKLNIFGNGGSINKLSISAKGEVNIDGKTENTVPVVVEESAAGAVLNTNIQLNLNVNASIELNVGALATNTVVNLLKAVEAVLSGAAENLNVNVSKEAEGAVVKSETSVTIKADANVKVELGEGAEGSEITTGENVNVEVKNETTEDVKVTDNNGNSTTIEKGEESKPVITPNPTPTPSNPPYVPNPTATPVPTATPIPTPVPVSKITVTSENNVTEIKKGLTLQLTATAEPANAANKTVTWESSNENVAVVDKDGLVTGMEVGDVTIKALAADGSGVTGEINLKVTQNQNYIAVDNVVLDKTTLNLGIGATDTLKATITPDAATNKAVTWETSDATVATVDNGVVTAVNEGTATITIKAADGKAASCLVTVTKTTTAVTGVVLSETNVTLNIGGTKELTATVSPTDASNKNVTWTSSDPAVVEVVGGMLTAKAAGIATVTVTTVDGGFKAECTVTVTKGTVAVTGVVLTETDVTLNIGDTKQLTATVNPTDASNKNVTWTSSDPAVVDVVGGLLTAKAAGTATITVTTVDGGKTAICTVTVAASKDASLTSVTYSGVADGTITQFATDNSAIVKLNAKASGTINLTFATKDPKATVATNPTDVVINETVTKVTVTVMAEDKTTTKEYTLYFITSPVANGEVSIATRGTVTGATSSAIITNGVADVKVASGDSIILTPDDVTVTGTGVTVSYQWYKDSDRTPIDPSESNNKGLKVNYGEDGLYYVEVKIKFMTEEIIVSSKK